MDRINHSSAQADKFGAGKDGWTNGQVPDPGSGTVPQANWFDGVQEELVGLIEEAGLTPTNADYTQLKAALDLLYGRTAALNFRIEASDVILTGATFDFTGQTPSPSGFALGDGGTKMYINGIDTVWQYTLTTAFDIGTASYASKSVSVIAQDTICQDVFFKDDGTKMYVLGSSNDKFFQYSLNPAWDVSTATYDTQDFSFSGQDTSPTSFFIGDSGAKLFLCGNLNNTVYRYSMSTPWDLSTISYDTNLFSTAGQTVDLRGIAFSNDGTAMFIASDVSTENVYKYLVPTAWDLSTAVYSTVSLDISGEDTTPRGIRFTDSGNKLFLLGSSNDEVVEYWTNRLVSAVGTV